MSQRMRCERDLSSQWRVILAFSEDMMAEVRSLTGAVRFGL